MRTCSHHILLQEPGQSALWSAESVSHSPRVPTPFPGGPCQAARVLPPRLWALVTHTLWSAVQCWLSCAQPSSYPRWQRITFPIGAKGGNENRHHLQGEAKPSLGQRSSQRPLTLTGPVPISTESLGSRHRSREHWAAPHHALLGNARHSAGMQWFHASQKCVKEKGSALWRKTKEELLRFNIPGPAAPPPSKPPSPTVSPTITKKATYLTSPNLLVNKWHQCSVPHCVSSECCWLYHCPEGILGNNGSFECLDTGRCVQVENNLFHSFVLWCFWSQNVRAHRGTLQSMRGFLYFLGIW